MVESECEQLRREISSSMRQLGSPSKLEDGRYFRIKKPIIGTTIAVYFRGVGANMLELAFEPGGISKCISKPRISVVSWIETMQKYTNRETHPNPRYNFMRIGIGSVNELQTVLREWGKFTGDEPSNKDTVIKDDAFIKVPFYIEEDGNKSLFLPRLKMHDGFKIGEGGNEQYIDDYWIALEKLSKMDIPSFRRLGHTNHLETVVCKAGNYEEVRRSYLEKEIQII